MHMEISGRFGQAVTLSIFFFFFSFECVTDDHKKINYTNCQVFFKVSLAAMVEKFLKKIRTQGM